MVPQGGNTGLVGGSVPLEGELVLSTERLGVAIERAKLRIEREKFRQESSKANVLEAIGRISSPEVVKPEGMLILAIIGIAV